ncbi:RNA polymerase sigma factor [Actinokineospora bangkokensis]|uniref:RNA polymerase subunit sigma n=1 Tax=Actinokineospora bangkokensis TaxID=1193682 RepID=A0A1Q9LNJ5_9PSEU|nr:RNA polymerase sigma factor [Actinokineospora bangkokensis]OLR93573.1 RNA polymerase subunit sigma [Actinokineospora bangkokensis]
MTDPARVLQAVWAQESARVVGALVRVVRDVGLAEELAQDALESALRQWPEGGVPDNPGAWLVAVAKRRAVDHLRRAGRDERAAARVAERPEHVDTSDDVLRLVFLTCHPALPAAARVALTLRLVAGLTTAEIARAHLVPEPLVTQRVADAKRTLAGVGVELPEGDELRTRLASVLEVVYLVFNEGYSATAGDDLLRPALCAQALRLGGLLAELAPHEAEVHGLVALMHVQQSRAAARTGPRGEPVRLHEQDRALWDPLSIRAGFAAMLRARAAGGAPGPYVLQAAIAVCHAQAASAETTDWARIAALYEALAVLLPTPVVRLNHAVAVSRAVGPEAALALVDPLTRDPGLRDYHLLPSVRGDLLLSLGRGAEARVELERAAGLTRNQAERAFLLRRAADLPASGARTFGAACAEFLAQAGVRPSTVRSYRQTLDRLRRALGDGVALSDVDAARVAAAFAAWDSAAARTWNRHRAALRSFAVWAGVDWHEVVPFRDEPPVVVREVDLAALWALDVPVREKALWRLLHESGAPVSAVLGLNVQDLDQDDRRAHSGDRWISWRAGTAALLPELIGDRVHGPLFLTDRRATRPGPLEDVCPVSGRHRLSYERAEYLFKQATRPLDPDGRGYTLTNLKPKSYRKASGPVAQSKA